MISCAGVRFQRDISEYQDRIVDLETKLAANSNDAEALRDLGVIYFETANYATAEGFLQKAYALTASDAKTMFYHGLNLEFQGRMAESMEVQARYSEISRLSRYRGLMQGRYQRLSRQLVRQEIRTLIGQEEQLDATRLQTKTLAVFPLDYQGTDERFAALGRGLSEMMIVDLGQVRELKLLERIRLQTLLDELQLAQSDVVDRQTAPRVGRLLGAGRILAGSFNVLQRDQLQIDMVSWDMVQQDFPDAVSRTGALSNLFRLEKQLVFRVITQMGIQLTEEERQNIQRVPTRNLQAFFAYCRGLQEEDAGRFDAAANFFQNAVQLDPEFQAAASSAEANENLSQAGGTSDEILSELAVVEGQTAPRTSQQDLINSRLGNLSNSIGSNFIPGQDTRKATEEAVEAGADLGELAEPPPPPPPPQGNQRR
ncbi:CsgG/HfaB family protein [bacterium]|nr:CsgG/HfaB family protein [bacterium]